MSKFKFFWLLILPLCFFTACSDDDDPVEPAPTTLSYATKQVTVVFMPDALNDAGFNSYILRAVAAFCDGGKLINHEYEDDNDSVQIVNAHHNTAYTFFRPTTMDEIYEFVGTKWKADNVNPISGQPYERRLLVLTSPYQLQELPTLSEGEEILLVGAQSSDNPTLKYLQIDSKETFQETAEQLWGIAKSNFEQEEKAYTTVKYYCPFETPYLTDGTLDVLTDLIGDPLQVNPYPSQAMVSLFGPNMPSLYSFIHIYGDTDSETDTMPFVVTDLRQYASPYSFPYYSKLTTNTVMISFDVATGVPVEAAVIYRRYDKALVAWLEDWDSGKTMPQTTRFSNKDNMVEVLNNF